jgi:hypothetical protein
MKKLKIILLSFSLLFSYQMSADYTITSDHLIYSGLTLVLARIVKYGFDRWRVIKQHDYYKLCNYYEEVYRAKPAHKDLKVCMRKACLFSNFINHIREHNITELNFFSKGKLSDSSMKDFKFLSLERSFELEQKSNTSHNLFSTYFKINYEYFNEYDI